jgi:hypothetical protein
MDAPCSWIELISPDAQPLWLVRSPPDTLFGDVYLEPATAIIVAQSLDSIHRFSTEGRELAGHKQPLGFLVGASKTALYFAGGSQGYGSELAWYDAAWQPSGSIPLPWAKNGGSPEPADTPARGVRIGLDDDVFAWQTKSGEDLVLWHWTGG